MGGRCEFRKETADVQLRRFMQQVIISNLLF